jgi:hypothetical protein
MKRADLFRTPSVSDAKKVLKAKGWSFIRCETLVQAYNWNTTYKQGDYGIHRQRVYIFLDPEGDQISMSTKDLKNYAH